MPGRVKEHYLRLSDGRALCYADVGPRNAPVIVHLHGVPSSRLELLNEARSCSELGLRVIAPDRPGCGGSDVQPFRRITDWPSDLTCLMDYLEVDRFGLLAVSGGAPYALACVREMPERLNGSALVSPVGQMHRRLGLSGVGAVHRMLFWSARHSVPAARCLALLMLPIADGAPRIMAAMSNPNLCPADRRALRELPREISRFEYMVESARQGVAGPVMDLSLVAGPWDFSLQEITTQVHIWHGDADGIVPISHARDLDAVLPRSHLHVCHQRGHVMLAEVFPAIVQTMDWRSDG